LSALKDVLAAVAAAVRSYPQRLQTKYGAILKLQVYAVVSLGLERIFGEAVK
jgi:hypothetical protein